MAGSGEIPLARSSAASSSAFSALATETSSGRWRAIWPASSSRLPPAASAAMAKRSGNASTTERHWRPIEPVEPKMASSFNEKLSPLTFLRNYRDGLTAGQINPNPIVPDNRKGQNQHVDSVKNAAMAG